MIAKKIKMLLPALLAVILLAGVVTGCTFIEAGKQNNSSKITQLTAEELEYFNGDEFFNGEYMNIRNQFLSSLYDTPEKVDLLELFYCGPLLLGDD